MFLRFVVLIATIGYAPNGAVADDLPWQHERRVIGPSELEPIENTLGSRMYDDARVVARLETLDGIGYCTSVRVGPDLFLTNYHCSDYKTCEGIQFHLAFEKSVAPRQQLIVRCKELVAKNVAYDYALFRVRSAGFSPRSADDASSNGTVASTSSDEGAVKAPPLNSFPVATLWSGALETSKPMFMAGHPGARFKEVDRGTQCALRTLVPELIEERQTITHTCDTEGGSSGSPMMDTDSGFVVALHWGGKDDFNMAIPMWEIIADLKKSLPPEVFSQLKVASANQQTPP
ncbi:MAG: trypsin-like peptidase domain-containing protein [Deltaproteobacteria bacterium]|nr:trypsin-like peptidase domain-containing protein [Deltaproteobacteria bacterium]